MNKLLIILLCCIFTIPAQSQRLRKWLYAADSAYAINDYKSAIRLYQVVLTYDSTLASAKYRIAESARVYQAYDLAIEYYKKIVEDKENLNQFPLSEYQLANIYKKYGKYTEAIRYFNSFKNNFRNTRPPGDAYVPLAEKEVEYCIKAREKISEFTLFDGRLTRMDTSGELLINTPRSDFGMLSINDTFYYTSIRNIYRDKKQYVRRHYAEIFKAAPGMPGEPMIELNKEGQHVGDLTFNSDETRAYYSVCENIDEYQVRCDLFYRDKINGAWGPEFKYPHNDPDFSTTQPHVGLDKLTNKEMLFFASDRLSDSLDRKDIFYSFIEGPTEFSSPTSIEAINTAHGDEMSPFFDSYTQTLYYSTDGDYTFGGADLFKVIKIGDEWINKINLGTEVNSSYDDGFLRFDSQREYAFISSDREESLQYDAELDACCFDIYRIPMKPNPEVVIVKTFDAITNEALFEVTIPRSIIINNGSDENTIKVDEQTNRESNIFNFGFWSPTDSYMLQGKREGYYDTLKMVNMLELLSVPRDTYEIELLLMPKPELQVLVFEQGTRQPIEYPHIELQRIEADKEIELITDFVSEAGISNNSKLFPIELNTNYLIKASKDPYIQTAQSASRVYYTVDDFKKITGGRFKDTVYLAKLPDFNALLPDGTVPLYFENDRPKMGRLPQFPAESYMTLYQEYKSKQGRYVSRLEKSPIVGRADVIRMSRFFTRELEDFQKLDTLVDAFIQYMENDYTIEIELRGYCSPIGNSDYNLQLSRRRIQCVQDLLENYNNGVLKPYIQRKQFIITPNPKGEEEAPPTVREYLSDLNASIFSYLSSLERRVDIFLIPVAGR